MFSVQILNWIQSKMKIFQTFQKNFALIHFKRNERPFNRTHLRSVIESVASISSAYVYLFHGKYSVGEYMDSIYFVAVGTCVCIAFVNTMFKVLQIFDFIDAVENFVNKSKIEIFLCSPLQSRIWMENENIFRIEKSQIDSHLRENQSIDRTSVWNSALHSGTSVCLSFHTAQDYHMLFRIFHQRFQQRCIRIATSILVSYRLYFGLLAFYPVHIMKHDLYVTHWLWRYPFDWKNPFGFLICAALQYRMILHTLRLVASVLSLALGTFLFAISSVKDLKCELVSINEMAKRKKTRLGVARKLYNFLEIHSDLKRLSKSRLNIEERDWKFKIENFILVSSAILRKSLKLTLRF